MDSIKAKLKSKKSDIEEAKIEEVIKTRNEVEKKNDNWKQPVCTYTL